MDVAAAETEGDNQWNGVKDRSDCVPLATREILAMLATSIGVLNHA
jgi:hypothetical protein